MFSLLKKIQNQIEKEEKRRRKKKREQRYTGKVYDMYKSSHNSGRALLSTSMEAAFKHAELGHWLDTKK